MPLVDVTTGKKCQTRYAPSLPKNSIGYDDEHRNRPPDRSCTSDKLGMVPHSAWNLAVGGRFDDTYSKGRKMGRA
jgi:hypothetical protein